MKKTTIFLSVAAFALVGTLMMGCNELEDTQPIDQEEYVTLKITVGREDSPQTRALTPTGVKTFAAREKIAVVYQSSNLGRTYKVVSEELTDSDIENEGKTATFTVNFPTNNTKPVSNGEVRIIYPAAMAKESISSSSSRFDDNKTINYDALKTQNGTLKSLDENLDLAVYDGSLNGTSLPTKATLTNKLTICAITLKNSDGSNEITGNTTSMVISDGTNNYYVNRPAAAGPIYVAMRPTDNANIQVTATTGADIYTKSLTGKTYEAGNGYNLSWRMTQETGVHGGFFSVSGSKVVIFAPGNLWASYSTSSQSWTWKFADHQYDFIGNSEGNKLIITSIKETTEPFAKLESDGSVDLFGWSTESTYYGIANSTSNDNYSGVFVDWGGIDGLGGKAAGYWRTMTCDNSSEYEWHYVLMDRTTRATVNGTANARFTLAKVNGVNGLLIFPDSYAGPTESQAGITWGTKINSNKDVTDWGGTTITSDGWAILESAGCVFLPAVGQRSGKSVNFNANLYSSSTKKSDWGYFPMEYKSGSSWNVYWNDGQNKYLGGAVRLVHDIN